MAEHGTRTMYVHYGCRCEACCRAEHQQYLKKTEAKIKNRTRSKWGDAAPGELTFRQETQRRYNAKRYNEFKSRPSTHARPIVWQEIAEAFHLQCALCGCAVDPNDVWVGNDGRKRYGRHYPTVDHIISLKRGGTDTLDNVQLLCKHCNSAKGAR